MKYNTLGLNKSGMVERKLVSLQDHNARAAEAYRKLGEPRLNGIACPNCAKELFDSSPSITLTTSPPQKHVHCSACDYRGTAFK